VFHAIKVILYSLFGETEVIGDFFIRQTFGDQRDQLLFLPR
jgi:hypothetical protein